MKIQRTRNARSGIITGLLSKVLHMGMPFITRTALLYILGTEYLGLSGLFSSLLSFLSLAELGVSNALVYSMYKPIAEEDEDTVCALLALYRKLYRMIGFVILAAGLICMPFLHLFISGDVPADVNLYVLYLLYLGNTVCSYFLFAYRSSLLTAHQRIDVSNVIDSTVSAVTWILQITMLLIFRNYYAFVIFMPVSNVAGNFIRLFYVKKHYPRYTPRGKVAPELESSIFKKIKALMGAKISTTVLHSSDNIVISAFHRPLPKGIRDCPNPASAAGTADNSPIPGLWEYNSASPPASDNAVKGLFLPGGRQSVPPSPGYSQEPPNPPV